MKYCCVIGGTGFIGSFVVNKLLSIGKKVCVIGRNELPSRKLPPNVKYIAGDFADKYFLSGVLRDASEVIDLAYASVPKTSYDNPVQDIWDNLPPAVTLLETASKFKLNKVVLVSSGGAVYGHTNELPIKETSHTNPISPYGITKLAIEKYAQLFHISRDLPVLCVRPGNAYGETQRPFVGQGFVATAIASIMHGKELTIFGEFGTVRDYIHVEDIASGIVAAMEYGTSGHVYNIGSGEGRTNRDILDALKPLAHSEGFTIKLNTQPLRKFDVPVNILDSSKLSKISGWLPGISFNDGIFRTWKWFKQKQ